MDLKQVEAWQHQHNFAQQNISGERRTWYVLIITAITMVLEIVAGTISGSMALLADGWHMGTHVAAFMITIFVYRYSRKHANNPYYSFGTGKVNTLGGFASAIALAVVALMMLIESLHRLIEPQAIRFNEAIAVAVIGLLVNMVGAWLLKDHHHHHGHEHGHSHSHEHGHSHSHSHEHDEHSHEHSPERSHSLEHSHSHEHSLEHSHSHHDHNLHAAYMHVLADALTSLLAIVALLLGKYLGLNWLDPIMGVVGAVIITRWAYGLLKQSGPILLDASIDEASKESIIQSIEADGQSKVSDVHIWKLSGHHYGAIISVLTHSKDSHSKGSHSKKSAEDYKQALQQYSQLSHLTVEVNYLT